MEKSRKICMRCVQDGKYRKERFLDMTVKFPFRFFLKESNLRLCLKPQRYPTLLNIASAFGVCNSKLH